MRAIRKTITNTIIRYYDRDGVQSEYKVKGKTIRSVERAISELLRNGISNVLIDELSYERTSYVMDAKYFIDHAKTLATVSDVDINATDDTDSDNTDSDNDNEEF